MDSEKMTLCVGSRNNFQPKTVPFAVFAPRPICNLLLHIKFCSPKEQFIVDRFGKTSVTKE